MFRIVNKLVNAYILISQRALDFRLFIMHGPYSISKGFFFNVTHFRTY